MCALLDVGGRRCALAYAYGLADPISYESLIVRLLFNNSMREILLLNTINTATICYVLLVRTETALRIYLVPGINVYPGMFLLFASKSVVLWFAAKSINTWYQVGIHVRTRKSVVCRSAHAITWLQFRLVVVKAKHDMMMECSSE